MRNEEENYEDILDLQDFDEEALKQEGDELLTLKFITPENARFSRTEGGFVALDFEGKTYRRIGVYLTFPLTNPDEYISIREADEKAKEIGVIAKLEDLDKDQGDMIREQIKLRYFTPTITKVIDVKDEYGYAYWNVITTFGACRFTTGMGGDSVVSLSDARILILDIDGNRYEIADFNALSPAEKKKLDIFI